MELLNYYISNGVKCRKDLIIHCESLLLQLDDFNRHDYIHILNALATAYEGECLFDKAIEIYNLLLSKWPNHSSAKVKISHIMAKQNNIEGSISYLENCYEEIKNNPQYYSDMLTNTIKLTPEYLSDLRCFPIYISELNNKKAKRYVYKPRCKK